METLEVHFKDFLVKWVNAPDNSIIDWQVKPLKKSINFAIYRKRDDLSQGSLSNGSEEASQPSSGDAPSEDLSDNTPLTPMTNASSSGRLRSSSIVSVNKLTDSYRAKSRSTLFSSHLKKSDLTLVKDYDKLIAEELVHGKFEVTNGGMYAFIFDNSFSKTTGKKVLFNTRVLAASSEAPGGNSLKFASQKVITSLKNGILTNNETKENTSQENGIQGNNILRPKSGQLLQSVLLKKRRKKLQGFTKRYFSLDFKYGTLSYFKMNSSQLRGQTPIKQSIISGNAKTRELIIDSGMEVWHLKALNDQDFNAWVDAFNKVKKSISHSSVKHYDTSESEQTLADGLQSLALKIRKLKEDVDQSGNRQLNLSVNGIENDVARLINTHITKGQIPENHDDELSVLSDNEFYDASEYMDAMNSGVVILDSGNRRDETLNSRMFGNFKFSSEDSVDKSDGVLNEDIEITESDSEADSDSDDSVPGNVGFEKFKEGSDDADFSLHPLPLPPIKRDTLVPLCHHKPSSILAFVRKNVGKDLSTIAMPVDMNEPLSALQKVTEMIEYSDLINNALHSNFDSSGEKILRIAAFAVSNFSSFRHKERNLRKPFNPLLGETYELVREDLGVRWISEKVCHRPPVFATYGESDSWTLSYSPCPSQKFWGKNFELTTAGTVKLTIKSTGEVFTWSQPTTLLKNIIAGERYSEPTGTMTVKSSTGFKAVVEFAKGGMFSGRAEDLTIKAYDSSKKELPYVVNGKWTESLTLKTNTTEKVIWEVGDLVEDPYKRYGYTKFAATLNKITEIEKNNLAPNDSRLRPDMTIYEEGKLDEAETLKGDLEEKQRERRKELETAGKQHEPFFFKHVGDKSPDSGEWVYIRGNKSYWNRRKNNDWDDIPSYF